MTDFLLATASVHLSAAACDYLEDRLSADDRVVVLSVMEEDEDPRDAGDAINVAEVRLGATATVETVVREGSAPAAILGLAGERSVDEILVGPRSGAPGGGTSLGGTARAVVEGADRPVVVVPLPDLS